MPTKTFFPTSIYQDVVSTNKNALKKLNAQLLDEIYTLSEDDEAGIKWSEKNYSNGYTSYASANQMHKLSPTFEELELLIRKHVIKFASSLKLNIKPAQLEMTTCWVNIMGENSSHSLHIHPHSTVSGTYYLHIPKNASAIRFEDPRYPLFMSRPPVTASAGPDYQTHVSLPAQPGEIILFESWLRHEVPLNPTTNPRVSISFNY